MRFIKWALYGVVGLAIVFVCVGLLLPRHVAVSRSITIAAAPDAVFPHVNSLRAARAWSPWMSIDPDIVVTFDGPEAGVGAKMSWTSDHPNVGSGAQEITVSEQDRTVESALDFGDMGRATARFDLVADGEGTLVTWGLLADMGAGPVGRWMGLMMDGWVGADYERGLASLKALIEG